MQGVGIGSSVAAQRGGTGPLLIRGAPHDPIPPVIEDYASCPRSHRFRAGLVTPSRSALSIASRQKKRSRSRRQHYCQIP